MQFTWRAAMQAYTEKDWRDFVFFSANVQHLLGIHQLDTQQNLHRAAINFSRRQAETDTTKFQFQDETNWILPERAQFILSFHFGYYRAVPAFLVHRGYKLCIPVAKDVILQQSQHYATLLGDRWQKQVVFLDAEDPYLFFKLRQQMDLGFHIFCYLDGGVSAAKDLQAQKLSEIPVLNGSIKIKHGILHMAFLLQKNITVLIAKIAAENEPIVICALSHWYKNWFPSARQFADYFSRIIYQDFEEVLLEYPEAWEAWLYLHKTMSPSSDVATWSENNRIISFSMQDKQLLLDKFTYLSYPLSVTIL
ncbi:MULTISPECIES: hypothetical protein [Sphingobacterium]|jgi:hypothetical protein|uniref:hypothetical protein n=1 Tax=Sphingobacterium TaxID=28453 RepID=UPI00257F76CA|nr:MULTISPECIES: hypothetical protein [Sphingobacterium]MDF2849879.1 hypothetical protein [Sphingobacterium multivorum]